jgi:predicted kinase
MIKLLDLLKEQPENGSKAIVMAGSAGAGKSSIVKQLQPDIQKAGWEELNADKYVEDKDSPMYNSLGKASSYIEKVDLPNAIKSGRSFLYDTTGTNVDRVKSIESAGYDVMMIMVYTNPVVSFLRNFKRERKVPTVGVLSSWNNVYKNISTYKSMFGDNFLLVQTDVSPAEKKMVDAFMKAYNSGKLKEFFSELLSSGQFTSTFRKDPTKEKSPEEKAKSKELVDKQIDILAGQFEDIEKQVESLKGNSIENVVSKAKSFIKS